MENRDLNQIGEEVEGRTFQFVKKVVNRLLDGYFHFSRRKGNMVAGSVTFFALLSFGPVLLALISLSGLFFESSTEAKNFVLGAINNNIPNLATWIYQSIDKIISTQLNGNTGFSFINFAVLVYASLGVISSLHFGLNTISKEDFRGGFFLDDIRAFVRGFSVALFLGGFFILSSPNLMKSWLLGSNQYANELVVFIVDYNLIPSLVSLIFFTFYYQWSTPMSVKLNESFKGACAFVGAFMLGKSFYWIYHLYTKDSLTQSFGNFYTLVVAVLWIYFVMCAFFFGASVACVSAQKNLKSSKPVAKLKDAPPPPTPEKVEPTKIAS